MKFINKYKKYIIMIFIVVVTIILIAIKIKLNYYQDNRISLPEENDELYSTTTIEEEKEEPAKISIDIKGAVVNPGVYEIEETKKVIDVIYLAGGLRDDADTSLINLAKKVKDEMVIVIYTVSQIEEAKKNENSFVKPIDTVCTCPKVTNDACLSQDKDTSQNEKNNSSSTTSQTTSDKVNINTATLEELQTLSGIGESKAEAIIEYREVNGGFNSIEDIKNVSGIGDSLYEKIKDFITI